MPRKPRSNWTIKATARAGRSHRQRLEQVIKQEGELYNSTLKVLEAAHQKGITLELQHMELQLTQVRKEYPEFSEILRKVSISTLKRAVTAWDGHAHPRDGTNPRGKPRQKTPERFRTITLDSPVHPIIRPSIQGGNPYLCIKGLPNLRITTHRKLPPDQQPSKVSITVRRRQVSIRLTYQTDPYPKPTPIQKLRNPRGIDLGVAITAMTSGGIAYTSPNENILNQGIKLAQRKLARKRHAAIRLGLAASRARLDANNHQMVSAKGRPQHEIVWLGPETSAYRKAHQKLQDLYEQRSSLRNDFRHRVTSAVVRNATREQADLLVAEDLQIANMTKSARGTVSQPGRNVRAKSGLNRSILQQGWGDFKTKLNYKAEKAGIRHVEINPRGTSQTCNQCGIRDPKSRVSQSEFQCTSCGFSTNADLNAAINIGDQGLYYLQKQFGKTPETIRLDRLEGKDPGSGKKDGAQALVRGASQPEADLKAQNRVLQGVAQFSYRQNCASQEGIGQPAGNDGAPGGLPDSEDGAEKAQRPTSLDAGGKLPPAGPNRGEIHRANRQEHEKDGELGRGPGQEAKRLTPEPDRVVHDERGVRDPRDGSPLGQPKDRKRQPPSNPAERRDAGG